MKKIKTEFSFSAVENITEKAVYQIGAVGCLIGHILYLIIFLLLGVLPMALYNCFSVVFYSLIIYAVTVSKDRSVYILVIMFEFALHACLGIFSMGWGLGFAMFILYIVPIPFYLPLKRISIPYVISALDLVIFVVMRLASINRTGLYVFDSTFINTGIYLLNMVFGFIIIIYISSIYMFNREIVQFKMRAKNESLQKLATIDPLTELFNRRAMMDYLRMIQSSSSKSGQPYVVALGDIDNFKHVNDTYGHDIGDEALKMVSKILTDCVPSEGYVCRWGGEEFLFAIPSSDVHKGTAVAQEICSEIAKTALSCKRGEFHITFTMGVCEAASDSDFEKIISIADNRLYMGKQNGRNQVVSQG